MSDGKTWDSLPMRLTGTTLTIATLAFLFSTTSTAIVQPHPRLWLTGDVLATLAAKKTANDPDWLTLRAAADRYLKQRPPRITITAASNATPVQFTTSAPLPWASGAITLFLAGGTGSWAGVNNPPPAGAWTATKTGTTTFTVPVDTSAFGSFTGQRLTAFAYGGETAGFLGYGQTGDQWSDAATSLSLAYRLTGTAAYRDKALEFLDWWNELGAANMVAPVSQDSGRGALAVPPAVAYVYDWLYPSLSAAQKTASYTSLNRWCTWIDANGYARHDATSNYWEGNQLAFLMAGYATLDENPQAQSWIDKATTDWQTDLVPMFQPPQPGMQTYGANAGFYYSGMAVSGFNYGGNDIQRHVQRLFLVKSATGVDVPDGIDYAKRWARNLLYQLKPDRWKAAVFGQWTGSHTGVMKVNDAIMLSAYLDGTTEGAWMQWYYQHAGTFAPGISADARSFVADSTNYNYRLLFYQAKREARDYTATEPPFYFSDGGEAHLIWRSGWATTDDYAYFRITPGFYSASHNKQAGHVDLTRGSDYLLVQASWWKGIDGISGSPDNSDPSSSFSNTLYFYADGCFKQGYPYDGCQLLYGKYLTPKVKLTRDYAFGENDFASMYDATGGSPTRPLHYFFRSFVALGDGQYVVWDRIESTKASDTKQIRWQLSSANAPTTSGNQIASIVGSSKLTIQTLLPAGAKTALVRNQVNGQPTNWRAEVTDPAPAPTYTGLTVLSTLPARGAAPSANILTDIESGFIGIHIAGSTPKVAILPRGIIANQGGTFTSATATSVRFSSAHSGNGRYVVAGLAPGMYSVSQNGAPLSGATKLDVDANGVLSFTSTAGAFVVATGGARSALLPVPPSAVATSGAASALPPAPEPQTGGRNVCRNSEFVLTADVLLAGSASVDLIGTPAARCAVRGNGHRFIVDAGGSWRGHFNAKYVDFSDLGTATLPLLGGPSAGGYAYMNGATLDIQHSTIRRSGGFDVFTANGAAITLRDNTYAADNLVPAGGPAAEAASWFTEQGNSTATKYFQGNKVHRALARFLSPSWVIGGAPGCTTTCDVQGNLFVGPRVGFELGAAGSYAAYNYVHASLDVTPETNYWSQVGNVGPIATGATAEHNVFRTGHWVASGIHGELRFNVLAEAHGHDFVRLGNGGKVHHNILLARYPGIDTYSTGTPFTAIPTVFGLFQAGNNVSFYNNTIDARNLSKSLLWVYEGATVNSFRNNVAYRVQLSANGCPISTACTSAIGASDMEGYITPPPSRALYLDYNDFFYDPSSPRKVTYAIGVAGKRECVAGWGAHDIGGCPNGSVDPQFRGPLPIGFGQPGSGLSGFPFNDADILDGVYTVSQILSYFRWVYAPKTGSPLIGAQDPQDGPGDIGAIQTRTLPASLPAIVATNKRPMVHGGASFAITDDTVTVTLSGYAADDGLPSNNLTVHWSKVSGPGNVTFGNPNQGITTARFTSNGAYRLMLTASDGALSSESEPVLITVGSSGVPAPVGTPPPRP